MRLKMKGVGILPETDFRIDGLTVISGINGTGKSTVLKTLYSILESSRNIDQKIKDDAVNNIVQLLMKYDQSPNRMYRADLISEYLEKLESARDRMTPYDLDLLNSIRDYLNGQYRDRFHSKALKTEIVREFGAVTQFADRRNAGSVASVTVEYSDIVRSMTVGDDDVSWEGMFTDMPVPIYYDSPYVMDSMGFDSSTDHRSMLRQMLHSQPGSNISREILNDDRSRRFERSVSNIVPGRFSLELEGLQYTDEKGLKLHSRNLATGMKVFSILKILVSKGYVNENTVLMLDEPEIHLHPLWINELAAVICILVKDLQVKVVMTTHNPQLLMALEGYSRNCGIDMDCYNLTLTEDGVDVEDVSGDLGPVYRAMSAPIRHANSIYLGE